MGKTRFADWSLNKKVLALVALAATLPLLAGVGLLVAEARSRVRGSARDLLAARADQIAAQLDGFHRRYRGLAHYLAQVARDRLAVADAVRTRQDGETPAVAVAAAMKSIIQMGDGVRGALVIDRQGIVVESSDAIAQRISVKARAYFQRALQGESYVTDIFVPAVGDRAPLIGYAAPVRDAETNIVGVAAVFVRAEAFWELVRANRGHAGQGSFALVYDQFGVRIAHGLRDDFLFRPSGPLPADEVARMAAEERFGSRTRDLLTSVIPSAEQFTLARSTTVDNRDATLVRTFSTANNAWNLTLARRLHEVFWTIVVVVPEASVFSGVDALLERSLLVSLLILAAALVGGWYVARTVLRPVRALGTAVEALEHGDLAARVPITANDEIGALGARFNHMAAALEASRTEMESRVKERTIELERKNIEVERADRLKSEFLANMSHELRTPLNSIIGFSELLIDEAHGELSQRHRQYLEDVFNSGKHLLRVINDILDLSKIEAGYVALDPTAIIPADIINDACQVLTPAAMRRGVTFAVHDRATRLVWADRAKLLQVMLNLLSNAVKFSHEGSRVEITAQDTGAFVRFTIADHGPGIDEGVKGRLFQPFVQGERPLNKRHQGTGLGLVISKRLVEQHGGAIELDSAVGTGTTLRFSIPVADPTAADAAMAAASSGATHEAWSLAALHALRYTPPLGTRLSQRNTVLVVDDNDINRELIRSVLERRGRRVLQANNVDDGLAMARAHHPDIVLMDWAISSVDGTTATQQLRSDPDTRHISIVALTTSGGRADGDPARAAGVDECLSKPIDRKRLEETVDRLLAAGRYAS